MKGKLMMGAACLALLLGSCVKDDESQSVTNIRDAKTEQLKSVAALNNATAEATKALAEAEAALKLAQAEAAKADAAYKSAEAKLKEAEAQLKEVEVEAARAELEALKAKYEAEVAYYQAEKAKHLAAMEEAAVRAEEALLAAKEALIAAEKSYQASLDGMAADEAARLSNLYDAYSDAAQALLDAKHGLAAEKILLAKAETDLIDAEEALAEILEGYDEDIAELQEDIAEAEAQIAVLEQYVTVSSEEVEAAVKEAEAVVFEADEARKAAQNEYSKAYTEAYNIWRELYSLKVERDGNTRYYGGYSEYCQLLKNQYISYDSDGRPTGWSVTRIDGLVKKNVRVEGVNNNVTFDAWGYEVEDDLTKTKFIPLFGYCNRTTVGEIEYQLEGNKSKSTESYYEKELGFVDETAIAEYLTWYEANAKEDAEANVVWCQNNYEQYAEYEAAWKAMAEVTLARKEAWDALEAAKKNAEQNTTVWNEETQKSEPTAYKAAMDAANKVVNAESKVADAKAADTAAKAQVKADSTALATAQAAKKAADKVVTDAGKNATQAQKDAAKVAADDVAAATEALEESTEKATWAAEDLKAAEAELKAAKAEKEAADKALEAAKAAVEPLEDAWEVAKREHEKVAAANNFVAWSEDSGVDAYNDAANNYKSCAAMAADALNSLNNAKESATDEGIQKAIKSRKKAFADLLNWKAWADEKLEAYNAPQKAIAELYVEFAILSRAYTIADAELDELNGILGGLTNASSYESRIADLEEDIEDWTEDIADLEQDKIDAADFTTLEEAIEQCELNVAMAEEKVKVCQIAHDAAKAAYEAATATPAE